MATANQESEKAAAVPRAAEEMSIEEHIAHSRKLREAAASSADKNLSILNGDPRFKYAIAFRGADPAYENAIRALGYLPKPASDSAIAPGYAPDSVALFRVPLVEYEERMHREAEKYRAERGRPIGGFN